MEPLVSIIVPVYNIAEYLEACVGSILAQTYGNYEVFLIDDGSTDGSGEICDAFAAKDARIRVLHQKNAGISAARNRGLEMAQGEYLTFVDGDDLIDRRYLEVLVSAVQKYGCELAICNYLDKEGESFREAPVRFEEYRKHKGKIACFTRYYEITSAGSHAFPTVWAKLIRRSIVQDLRFHPKLTLGEDIAYMYQCYLRDISLVEVPYDGYFYVQRTGSMTRGGVPDFIVEALPAWRIVVRKTKGCEPEIRRRVARDYGFVLYSGLSQLIRSGDYAKYREKTPWLKACCRESFGLRGQERKHSFMLKLYCFSPRLYWRVVRTVLKMRRR